MAPADRIRCIAEHVSTNMLQRQQLKALSVSSPTATHTLAPGCEKLGDDTRRFVEYFNETWISSGRLGSSSGATLAVCNKDGLVLRAIFGNHAEDSIYVVNSLTKIIASLALMQLKEKGLVKLDEPVSSYLPFFASQRRVVDGIEGVITLRQCLNHTTGLASYMLDNIHPQKLQTAAEKGETEHWMEAMSQGLSLPGFCETYESKCALMFPPGTHFNYSSSPNVLAAIVENVSGQTFPAYVRQNITGPLGMKDTFFQATNDQASRMLPSPVDKFAQEELGAFMQDGLIDTAPADEFARGDAGLKGTCDDWVKLAQVFVNHGELHGVRVLSRAGIKEMTTNSLPNNSELIAPFGWDACDDQQAPHFGLPHDSLLSGKHRPSNSFPGQGFGLGFAVVLDGQKAGLHRKATGTCWWMGLGGTFFGVNPQNGIGCLLFTNEYPHGPRMKAFGEVISFANGDLAK